MTTAAPLRIVMLGASNLTRGFPTVVSTASAAWGPDVQVLAAHGYGRSYGAPSRVLVRTLPGILESGLWLALDSLPEAPTRAYIGDVGNDVLYGYPAEQILAWVEEVVARLQRHGADVTLTDLPVASVHGLSNVRFLVFRSLFFPFCRIPLVRVREAAEAVSAGLAKLAASRNLRFFRLQAAWYGLDPIHIRRSLARTAWQAILGTGVLPSEGDVPISEQLQLFFLRPERRWLLGIEQRTPQGGVRLPSGGRIWLY